jgi:hypothetical protein
LPALQHDCWRIINQSILKEKREVMVMSEKFEKADELLSFLNLKVLGQNERREFLEALKKEKEHIEWCHKNGYGVPKGLGELVDHFLPIAEDDCFEDEQIERYGLDG